MSSANQTTPTLTISGQPARPPSAVFGPPSDYVTGAVAGRNAAIAGA